MPIIFKLNHLTTTEIHKMYGRGLDSEEEYNSLYTLYGF